MVQGSGVIWRDLIHSGRIALSMFCDTDYIAHHREKDGEVHWLSHHLIEVSKKTGEFASRIGLKEPGEIIGLLHDIGKASKEFQDYIKSAVGLIGSNEEDYVDVSRKKGKIDHTSAGAQWIYQTLANKGHKSLLVAQVLSLCIVSHHSGLLDCISPEGVDTYSKRMDRMEEKTHLKEVLGKIGDETKAKITELLQSEVLLQNALSQFEKLRSRLDSKDTFCFKYGLLVRFLFSCLIDADRLDTADFEEPALRKLRPYGDYQDWKVLIGRLNKKLEDFDSNGINAIRQKISEACGNFADRPKGLYQLTVPTGGGKTFASLRFALHHANKWKMDRIIYVLPFTTIIDQNADEIRKVLEEKDETGEYLNNIVLEHHSNLTPEEETARQRVLSENWDAPVVLTTNVQVLETLFGSGTRGIRRMHQLANAVIIFDEVQTLPVKCVYLFNVAINFLINNCGSTVVLCTATQPLLDKIEPKSRALPITSEQQLISNTRQLFDELKRVEVKDKTKSGGWSIDEIKGLASQKVVESGSVLIVVNTKTSARKIYQQCKQIDKVETYHLSTNMCPAHRMVVLDQVKACLRDKKPVICVSTQLIEAGVDISFGSVIRFLAGLDSIAQAAGRCNRHNEQYPRVGEVFIINPSEENIDRLEDIKIGKEKTERLLGEFKDNQARFGNNIISPAAMEQYYQYYFYQRKAEMNYPVTANSPVGREDNLFNLLSVNSLSVEEYSRINGDKYPAIPLRQAFMTASRSFQTIESITQGIVVPYGDEGKDILNRLCSVYELERQYKLIRQAQRYSVNVFPDVLRRLKDIVAVHEIQEGSGIFYLDERYYSEEFGLSEQPVNNMRFLNI